MALSNYPKNWAFTFEPHTASRATREALVGAGAVEIGYHHASPSELGERDNLHWWATVRNPFDLFISWWKVNPGFRHQPLREYVQSYFAVSDREPMFSRHAGHLRNTHVVFYERLAANLEDFHGATLPFNEDHVTRHKEKKWWEYWHDDPVAYEGFQAYGRAAGRTYGYSIEVYNGRLQCFLDTTSMERFNRGYVRLHR